jgi:hypothetical protein
MKTMINPKAKSHIVNPRETCLLEINFERSNTFVSRFLKWDDVDHDTKWNFEHMINPKRHYESNKIDRITEISSRNIKLEFSRKSFSLASSSSGPLFRSQSTR